MSHPMPTRIVVLHDFAEPEGGAGMLAHVSARGYRDAGIAVTYICGEGSGCSLSGEGIDVVALGGKGLLATSRLQGFRQGYHNSQASRAIADWIAQNDTPTTAYHLHNWSQILSPAVFSALRPVEDRLVVSCHDFFSVCPNGGFVHFRNSTPCDKQPLSAGCLMSQCDRRSAVHKYWRAARHAHLLGEARFAESRAAFVFLHEGMMERARAGGFAAPDARAVRNPVEAWSRSRLTPEARSSFLFVGRVGKDKGTDLALEAARRAGVHLVVAGTGPDMEGLSAEYAQAQFVGWQDRAGLQRLAQDARALLMPSRFVEPFGLVALEAACSGLPVVTSQTAYVGYDLETIGAGIRTDVRDADGFARVLSALAADDARVRAMSEAGFARGQDLCHTPESWVRCFLDIMSGHLARRTKETA